MRRSWPLGVQLNLLLLLVIVPFLGAVAYQYWTDVEQARENAGKRLVLIARAVAADANSDLAHAQDVLRLMARRPLIRAVDPTRCDPFLAQFAQLHPEWSNAGVVDLKGRLVCTVESYRGKGLYAIVDRGLFFDEAVRSGRAVISRPFLGPLTKTWVVVMAQPIHEADGSVRGLLVAALHLAKLRPPRAGYGLAPGDTIDVFDRSGAAIMRSVTSQAGTGKPLAEAVPAVRKILAHGGREGILTAAGPGGRRIEYGYATIELSGWRVAVGKPQAEVYAQANTAGWRRALIGLLAAAATLAGGLLLSLRIRRSIRRVTDAVDEVRRGNFEVRLPQDGPAEIARLAAGFNRMLDIRVRAVSGLRKANRTLGMMTECNKAMLRARSEQELLERMCRIAVDLGGYSLAWVGYAESGPDKRVREVAHAGPDGGYLSGIVVGWGNDDAGRGPCGRAIREREPIIVRDTGADPSFAPWKDAAHAYEFRTCACFPLAAGERSLGALNLYSRDSDAFSEEDAALLRGLCDDLAYGIQALRAEADRSQMLAEQELLLDSTGVGIAFLKENRVVHSNRGYAAMFGYGREEIVGVHERELHASSEAYDAAAAEVQSGIAESGRYAGERQYRRRDGSLFWVSYELRPLDPAEIDRGMVWTGYDITQARQAEHALRESEARLRVTLEATRVGIWDWNLRTGVWHANPTYFTMLGYEPDPGPQTREIWASRRHPDDRDTLHAALDAVREHGRKDFDIEFRVRHADGSYRWMNTSGRTVEFDHRGRPQRMLGLQIDVTGRKEAERAFAQSEELLRQLAANIPEAFWVREADSEDILYVSPGWHKITGAPPLGKLSQFWDIVLEEDRERVQAEAREAKAGGIDHEFRIMRGDGELRWLHVRSFPIRDAEGNTKRVAGVAEDVTDQKAGEQRLVQLAHYDHLTDLPNRAYFTQALERILAQGRRSGWIVGVLFIDLDRFKGVNDTLGHAAGDELLQQGANRLLQCVRVRDVVGRLGGDEYALILPGLEQPQHAGVVAAKILAAFGRPFDIGGRELFVTPSIGVTLFPADGAEAGELLRNADAAMYRAKEEGRNTFRYYTAQMNRLAAEKLELEARLRHALERGEFLLHYQPKLELASGRICGLEALLRWQRPGAGLVPPAEFVPLLEETGLIVAVGDWLIGEACRQLKAWQAEGIAPPPVALNLSPRQLREKDLAARIERVLREHALEPGLIELEITETALMSNEPGVVTTLGALRAAGMGIALDDFGTGYSSLSFLKRFPITAVKIDRSFVRDVLTDANDAAIALSVIGIGRNLGIKVIAEGVESEAQLEFLRANGCDEVQGYLIARPAAAAETAEFMRRKPGSGLT